MTTIAACFSKREIAADSMVTLEGACYSVNKLRKGALSVYGAAGEWDACLKFLQAIEINKLEDLEVDVTLLELRKDGLWVYESCLVPSKIKNDFYAIGSGAPYAIAAMKLGCTPTEAVAIACEFDPASRLPVDTLYLGKTYSIAAKR
jgi:hypothetical protein